MRYSYSFVKALRLKAGKRHFGVVKGKYRLKEIMLLINSFPNNNISDWSKLKDFADTTFKFGENGRKFSKRVENTVGKGEIAHHEQFLLFPQCFQRTCTADM